MNERHVALSQQLVALTRDIKILGLLSWPASRCAEFLAAYNKGNRVLPRHEYPAFAFTSLREELRALEERCDTKDAVQQFIAETALSYRLSLEMLEAVGTKSFAQLSIQLYGSPSDHVIGGSMTDADVALNFLRETDAFQDLCGESQEEICILPETVAAHLQETCDSYFGAGVVQVVLDAELDSKAAAGLDRIRIRSGTCFSRADVGQLREHECLVHTLTAQNGKKQPAIDALALSAPRTTRTQEGLALFAELVTHSIDLARLRRVAARVSAIQLALGGADFIDVFEFFRLHGQTERESYYSAFRVFRGGDVGGGVAFTKDAVYLAGLTDIISFLRKALDERKLHYLSILFSGRMALRDVFMLESSFETGELKMGPHYPAWLEDLPRLSAYLLSNTFFHAMDISSVDIASFAEHQAPDFGAGGS